MTTFNQFRWNRLTTLAAALLFAATMTHSPTVDARRFGGLRGLRAVTRTAAVASRVYGRQPTGGYVLSQSELKTCLVMKQRIEPIATRLESGGNQIEDEQDSLSALEREIERSANYVDNTSQYEVDRFNRKVDQYNAQRSRLQTKIDRWNAQLSAVKTDFERFDSQCGGRSYYESDKQTVLASLAN